MATKKHKDFSKLEYIPQMGDAILVHDNRPDIIGDGIEWFTNGKVSHVDVYVGGGEGKIIGALASGVKVHYIDEYFKDYYTIYVRRIKGITVDQAAKIKELAYKYVQKRTGYDYISYLGYMIANLLRKIGINIKKANNPFDSKKRVVCSSFYDKICKKAGIDLFPNIGEEFVTPQDILESKKLETILII